MHTGIMQELLLVRVLQYEESYVFAHLHWRGSSRIGISRSRDARGHPRFVRLAQRTGFAKRALRRSFQQHLDHFRALCCHLRFTVMPIWL